MLKNTFIKKCREKVKNKNSKKGMALSTAICITVVLLIVTAAIISISYFNLNYTNGSLQRRQAFLDVKSALSYCEAYYVDNEVPGIEDLDKNNGKIYFLFDKNISDGPYEICFLDKNKNAVEILHGDKTSNTPGAQTLIEEKIKKAKTYVEAFYSPEKTEHNVTTKEHFSLLGYSKSGKILSDTGTVSDYLSLIYGVKDGKAVPMLDDEDEIDIEIIEEYKYVNIHVKPYKDTGLEPYIYAWSYNDDRIESILASDVVTKLTGDWLGGYSKTTKVQDKTGKEVYVFADGGPQGSMQYEGNGWYTFTVMVPRMKDTESFPKTIQTIIAKQDSARNYSIDQDNGKIFKQLNENGQTSEIYGIPLPEGTGHENAEDVYIRLNEGEFKDYPNSDIYTHQSYISKIKDNVTVYKKYQNTDIHFRVANQFDDNNITGTPYIWVQSQTLKNNDYVPMDDGFIIEGQKMEYEGYGWYRYSGIETANPLKVWVAIDSKNFDDAVQVVSNEKSTVLIGDQTQYTEKEKEISRELFLTAWTGADKKAVDLSLGVTGYKTESGANESFKTGIEVKDGAKTVIINDLKASDYTTVYAKGNINNNDKSTTPIIKYSNIDHSISGGLKIKPVDAKVLLQSTNDDNNLILENTKFTVTYTAKDDKDNKITNTLEAFSKNINGKSYLYISGLENTGRYYFDVSNTDANDYYKTENNKKVYFDVIDNNGTGEIRYLSNYNGTGTTTLQEENQVPYLLTRKAKININLNINDVEDLAGARFVSTALGTNKKVTTTTNSLGKGTIVLPNLNETYTISQDLYLDRDYYESSTYEVRLDSKGQLTVNKGSVTLSNKYTGVINHKNIKVIPLNIQLINSKGENITKYNGKALIDSRASYLCNIFDGRSDKITDWIKNTGKHTFKLVDPFSQNKYFTDNTEYTFNINNDGTITIDNSNLILEKVNNQYIIKVKLVEIPTISLENIDEKGKTINIDGSKFTLNGEEYSLKEGIIEELLLTKNNETPLFAKTGETFEVEIKQTKAVKEYALYNDTIKLTVTINNDYSTNVVLNNIDDMVSLNKEVLKVENKPAPKININTYSGVGVTSPLKEVKIAITDPKGETEEILTNSKGTIEYYFKLDGEYIINNIGAPEDHFINRVDNKGKDILITVRNGSVSSRHTDISNKNLNINLAKKTHIRIETLGIENTEKYLNIKDPNGIEHVVTESGELRKVNDFSEISNFAIQINKLITLTNKGLEDNILSNKILSEDNAKKDLTPSSAVGSGSLYFNNGNTNWDNVYLFLGHGGYLRSYEMTKVNNQENLYTFNIQSGNWADATGFYFSSSDGGVLSGTSSSNINTSASTLGITVRTRTFSSYKENEHYIPNSDQGLNIECTNYAPFNIEEVLNGSKIMFYIGEPLSWGQNRMYVREHGNTNNVITSTNISEIGSSSSDLWGPVMVPGNVKYNLTHTQSWVGVDMKEDVKAGAAYQVCNENGSNTIRLVGNIASIEDGGTDAIDVSLGEEFTLITKTNANISSINKELKVFYYVKGGSTEHPIAVGNIVSKEGTATINSEILGQGNHEIIPVITDGEIYVKGDHIKVKITNIEKPENVSILCSPKTVYPKERVKLTANATVSENADIYYIFEVDGVKQPASTINEYTFTASETIGQYNVAVTVYAKEKDDVSESVRAETVLNVVPQGAYVDQKSQVFNKEDFKVNLTKTSKDNIKYSVNGKEPIEVKDFNEIEVINGSTINNGETVWLCIYFKDDTGANVTRNYIYTKESNEIKGGIYAEKETLEVGNKANIFAVSKPISEEYKVYLSKDGILLGDITNYVSKEIDDNNKGTFEFIPSVDGEYVFTIKSDEDAYLNHTTIKVTKGQGETHSNKYALYTTGIGEYTANIKVDEKSDYLIKTLTEQKDSRINSSVQDFSVIDNGDGTISVTVKDLGTIPKPETFKFDFVNIGNSKNEVKNVKNINDNNLLQNNNEEKEKTNNQINPVSYKKTIKSSGTNLSNVSTVLYPNGNYVRAKGNNIEEITKSVASTAKTILESGFKEGQISNEGKIPVGFLNGAVNESSSFLAWDRVYVHWQGSKHFEDGKQEITDSNPVVVNGTPMSYYAVYIPMDAEYIYFSNGGKNVADRTVSLRSNTFAIKLQGVVDIPTYYPLKTNNSGHYSCGTPMEFIQNTGFKGGIYYDSSGTMAKVGQGKEVYSNIPLVNALLSKLEESGSYNSNKQYIFTSCEYRKISVNSGEFKSDNAITYNNATYYYVELNKNNYNVKFSKTENSQDVYKEKNQQSSLTLYAQSGESYLFFGDVDGYTWIKENNYNTNIGSRVKFSDDRIGTSQISEESNNWYTYKIPTDTSASFEIEKLDNKQIGGKSTYPVTGFEKLPANKMINDKYIKDENINVPIYVTLNSDEALNGYYTDISTYTYNPEEANVDSDEKGNKLLYFKNNEDWEEDSIYVYYWGIDTETVSWPGIKMEPEKLLENGFKCEVPETATYLIINNGKMADSIEGKYTSVLSFTGKEKIYTREKEVLYDSFQNKNGLSMYSNPRTTLISTLNYAQGICTRGSIFENYKDDRRTPLSNNSLSLSLYKEMYNKAYKVCNDSNSTAKDLKYQTDILLEHGQAYEKLMAAVKNARIYLDDRTFENEKHYFPEGLYKHKDIKYTEYSLQQIEKAYLNAIKYFKSDATKLTSYEKGRYSIENTAELLQSAISAKKIQSGEVIQIQLKNHEEINIDESTIELFLDGNNKPTENKKYKTVLGNHIYLTIPKNTKTAQFKAVDKFGKPIIGSVLKDIQTTLKNKGYLNNKESSLTQKDGTPVFVFDAPSNKWYLKENDVKQIKYSQINQKDNIPESVYHIKRDTEDKFAIYFNYNTIVNSSATGEYMIYSGMYQFDKTYHKDFWNNGVNLFSKAAKDYFIEEVNYGMDEITLDNNMFTASTKLLSKYSLELGGSQKKNTKESLSTGWIDLSDRLVQMPDMSLTDNQNKGVNFHVGNYYYNKNLLDYTLYLQIPQEFYDFIKRENMIFTCKFEGGAGLPGHNATKDDYKNYKITDKSGYTYETNIGEDMELFKVDSETGYAVFRYGYNIGHFERIYFYILDGTTHEILWRTSDHNIKDQFATSDGSIIDSGGLNGYVITFDDLDKSVGNTSNFNSATWIHGSEYGDGDYPSGQSEFVSEFAKLYEVGENIDNKAIYNDVFQNKKQNGKINFRFAYNTSLDFNDIRDDRTVKFKAKEVTFACNRIHGTSTKSSIDKTSGDITGNQHFYILADKITFHTNTKVTYYDYESDKVKTFTYTAGTYEIKENEKTKVQGIDLFNPKAAAESLRDVESKRHLSGGVYVR